MTTPQRLVTDTELSAVNSILGSIGQSPVNTLGNITVFESDTQTREEIINTYENPEISMVHNLLMESVKDVLNEGWSFNTEDLKLTPEDTNKRILVPADALRIDMKNNQYDRTTNVVVRDGILYDKVHNTYAFDSEIEVTIVRAFEFKDIPSVFQRYITYKASTRAATQLVANPQLVQLLAQQEIMARAGCMEYECDQGDANFMGFPSNSTYQTFQPFRALHR